MRPVTNTIRDIVGATINRGLKAIGVNTEKIHYPTTTWTERNISSDDALFLREAARRAETAVPQFKGIGRKKYFEQNPDAEVRYHFTGKVSKGHPVSGYQQFFGTPYGGVKQYGVMRSLSTPNIRMQNSLGGFDIVYTKDGIRIEDNWHYHNKASGDTKSLPGMIKYVGENLGT